METENNWVNLIQNPTQKPPEGECIITHINHDNHKLVSVAWFNGSDFEDWEDSIIADVIAWRSLPKAMDYEYRQVDKFSKRLNEIFINGDPTKALIIDAFHLANPNSLKRIEPMDTQTRKYLRGVFKYSFDVSFERVFDMTEEEYSNRTSLYPNWEFFMDISVDR